MIVGQILQELSRHGDVLFGVCLAAFWARAGRVADQVVAASLALGRIALGDKPRSRTLGHAHGE